MSNELKKCPCGGTPQSKRLVVNIRGIPPTPYVQLKCDQCGESQGADSEHMAAVYWNLWAENNARCSCDEFRKAQESCTDNEAYSSLARVIDGEWKIGACALSSIQFCPWCGRKTPLIP